VFDVLIYTDCAENESLNGRTGFQFTAKSPDATPSDEEFVRTRLQHAVPIALPAEDWQAHPPTCAYALVDGRAYLSRGVSTGQTLSGRPGNQLTQTILTSDQHGILPQRPAQLFSSPNWTFVKPSSREVPGWETPLEVNPSFEIAGLHSLIADDDWASGFLPIFLTMVEQTQEESRVRLIIKHSDQDLVMKWIALASQFLDDSAALALEFRVFAENPKSVSAHIVGAHPAMSPELTAARSEGSGFHLVDLEAREHTSPPVSASAERHAKWFVSGDPYEALEAVSASRRWAEVIDPMTAAEAAEVACLSSSNTPVTPTRLRAAAATLGGLAAAQRLDEVESYGDPLIDAIASCSHGDPEDLLAIVDCFWRLDAAGMPSLAQDVALAALEWAAARPDAAASWARERAVGDASRRLRWASSEARQHAAGLVTSILRAAPAAELSPMFILANSLETGVSPYEMQADVLRLVEAWVARPGLATDARRGLHDPFVVLNLRSALARALSAKEPAALRSLQDGAWDWLAHTPWIFDSLDPMSPWLATRALATAGPRDRSTIISAAQASLPLWAWKLMLPTTAGIDPREAVSWVRTHGAVDPGLARPLEEVVLRGARGELTRKEVPSLLELFSLPGVDGISPTLAEYAQNHRLTTALFAQALQRSHAIPNEALVELALSSGPLLGLYGDLIVRTLIEVADLDAALRLAERGGGVIENELKTELESRLLVGDVSSLVGALRLLRVRQHSLVEAAKAALDSVWDDPQTEVLRQTLERRLPRDWIPAYEDYVRTQSKGRHTRGFLKTTRSMLRGEGNS